MTTNYNTTPMTTETSKRLYLIDGTALAYRSYFAFQRNPLTDSKGRNISAIFGFFSTLLSIISREKPDYLAIFFDTKAPTFRHVVFPEYKATRQKMPEDMAEQLPILDDVIEASGIKTLSLEGYEADDLMGTSAVMGAKEGFEVMMVTGDKDFYQLVTDKIKVYNLRAGTTDPEILGPAEVEAKFGVPPDKIIDTLGLMGDSSDNIPGVKGIGVKTAVQLIKDFGSIENIIDNVNVLKGAVKTKIEEGIESARKSRELVTIKIDSPVDFNPEEWKLNLNDDNLREKFRELGFTLFMKYLGEEKMERHAVEYNTVDTVNKLDLLCKTLTDAGKFAFDTETTSEDPMLAKLVGLSFAVKDFEAFYIPCNGFDLTGAENTDAEFRWYVEDVDEATSYILSRLQPLLENPELKKTAQNGKYDMTVLHNYGIEVKGFDFDTMIAHYLIDPGARGHGLDALSMLHLNVKKIPTSDLIGSGAKQITMGQVPVEKVSYYACEDADCTYRLKGIFSPQLDELSLQKLFDEVEMPLVNVLLTVEMNGVALDVDRLNRMSEDLGNQLVESEKNIFQLAGGVEFNINSPKQLAEILFEKLRLPTIRKTKTGYSTDESVLKKLAIQHPLPAEVLNYRSLSKLKSTYTDALPKLVNPHTGRVHTSYNQTVAATGRLSSTDPNLQNIPVRSDTGGHIREAFIPMKPGWKLLSADYSQIELRILAHISQDPGFLEAFRKGEDIHSKTAGLIFNMPKEFVTPDDRRAAKEVNFGVIYGMRDFGLSERLGIPRKRAKEFIDSYFESYPNILGFVENTIEFVKEKGYAETMLGRKRPLPEINSKNFNIRQGAERVAINYPIQGSAADMIKLAMIKVHDRMKRENVRSLMIMQVHDELVFEVPEDEMDSMKKLVVEEMENALPLSLPVKVDANYGDNWLEAH